MIASFQRAAAGFHANHFGAKQTHAKNIQLLALHVFGAHVDRARKSQPCRDGRSRHSVLARSRFRDDAFFAHPRGQQALTECVVYFVRASVQQIFALDVNARAAQIAPSDAKQTAAA